MSWVTIRDGMQTRLATIVGLQAHDTVPTDVTVNDAAVVSPGDPLIRPSGHSGKVEVNIRVSVRTRRDTSQGAQDALDAYVWPAGANSIVAAVYAAPTLGGAVDDTRFVAVEAYGVNEPDRGVWTADVLFTAMVTA